MDDDYNTSEFELFLLRIAVGKDPISGEPLPENSTWRDVEITDAVFKVLAVQRSTFIEHSAAKSSDFGPDAKPIDQFLADLTEDQKCIWDTIESSSSGISFSQLCERTGLSSAKVQGHLGAITIKSRSMFGEDYTILKKIDRLYFPCTSIPAERTATSKVTSYHDRIATIKERSPNAYARWDDDQEVQLRDLFERQTSIQDIAKVMGRQKGGILSRLRKMGLIEQDDAKKLA